MVRVPSASHSVKSDAPNLEKSRKLATVEEAQHSVKNDAPNLEKKAKTHIDCLTCLADKTNQPVKEAESQ